MKALLLITSMLALGLMGVGCSKSKSNSDETGAAAPVTGASPTVTGSGSTSPVPVFTSGSTSDLVASVEAMRAYTNIPGNFVGLNNPQNIKINLDFKDATNGRYGGKITISYYDNGLLRTADFETGLGRNANITRGYDNNSQKAEFNFWFNFEGKLVFSGFFEDAFGAMVVVLTPDGPVGGGNDAEPMNGKYKGSVYFKNFARVKNDLTRSCWHIYAGTFDCRSNVVQTKCGLEPGVDAGYTLLGTFTNVDVKKAFNLN